MRIFGPGARSLRPRAPRYLVNSDPRHDVPGHSAGLQGLPQGRPDSPTADVRELGERQSMASSNIVTPGGAILACMPDGSLTVILTSFWAMVFAPGLPIALGQSAPRSFMWAPSQ